MDFFWNLKTNLKSIATARQSPPLFLLVTKSLYSPLYQYSTYVHTENPEWVGVNFNKKYWVEFFLSHLASFNAYPTCKICQTCQQLTSTQIVLWGSISDDNNVIFTRYYPAYMTIMNPLVEDSSMIPASLIPGSRGCILHPWWQWYDIQLVRPPVWACQLAESHHNIDLMVTNIRCGAPTEYSEDIQQYQMHADIFSEFNFEYTMHRKKIFWICSHHLGAIFSRRLMSQLSELSFYTYPLRRI